MSLARFEVGIVSANRSIVDFLAAVFALGEEPPMDTPVGTLHRLQSPGATSKAMVPAERPAPADVTPFLGTQGIRYLTMWVTDLDDVISRYAARGGTVVTPPFKYEPDTRLAVITDPDGTTIEVVEALSTDVEAAIP